MLVRIFVLLLENSLVILDNIRYRIFHIRFLVRRVLRIEYHWIVEVQGLLDCGLNLGGI